MPPAIRQRRERGEEVLNFYAVANPPPEDPETTASDLIADVLHAMYPAPTRLRSKPTKKHLLAKALLARSLERYFEETIGGKP